MQNILLGQTKVMQIRQRKTLSHQRAIIHRLFIISSISYLNDRVLQRDGHQYFRKHAGKYELISIIGWTIRKYDFQIVRRFRLKSFSILLMKRWSKHWPFIYLDCSCDALWILGPARHAQHFLEKLSRHSSRSALVGRFLLDSLDWVKNDEIQSANIAKKKG